MRRFLAALAVASLSAVSGAFQEAKADLDPKYIEGLQECFVPEDEIVPHKKGYDAGKFAATAINTWYFLGNDMEPGTGDEGPQFEEIKRNVFLKSRSRFADIAPFALSQAGKHKQAGCLVAQLDPLKKDSWSSVHSGLTDALEPELKEHFFAIPEF